MIDFLRLFLEKASSSFLVVMAEKIGASVLTLEDQMHIESLWGKFEE